MSPDANRTYMREYMRQRRALHRQYRDLAKQACSRCGAVGPDLQFHHRDPAEKRDNPGTLVGNTSLDRYLEELAKCDVLCRACHLDTHYPMPDHGTRARYGRKCRCQACRAAWSAYLKAWKERRRQRRLTTGVCETE